MNDIMERTVNCKKKKVSLVHFLSSPLTLETCNSIPIHLMEHRSSPKLQQA